MSTQIEDVTPTPEGVESGDVNPRTRSVWHGVALALFMLSLPVIGAFFMHQYGDRSVSELFGIEHGIQEQQEEAVPNPNTHVLPDRTDMPSIADMAGVDEVQDDPESVQVTDTAAPSLSVNDNDENPCDQYADQPPSSRYTLNLKRGGVRVYSAATWCAYNRALAVEVGSADLAADSIDVDGESVTVEDCVVHLPVQTDGKNLYSRACSALTRGGDPTVRTFDLSRLVFERL